MTDQEVLWQHRLVWVVGILSGSGRLHYRLREFVGRGGVVERESKNGQLLVRFSKNVLRCVPAGCVAEYGTVTRAKPAGRKHR